MVGKFEPPSEIATSALHKSVTTLDKAATLPTRSRRLQTKAPFPCPEWRIVSRSCDKMYQGWIGFIQGSVAIGKAGLALDKAGAFLPSLSQPYIKMRQLYIRL